MRNDAILQLVAVKRLWLSAFNSVLLRWFFFSAARKKPSFQILMNAIQTLGLTSALLVVSTLSAQTISFDPVADFASAEIEKNGLDFAGAFPDPGTANATLYNGNYGLITTGNTISRENFQATMSAAFAGGYGGVYGFDADAGSHGDYSEVVFQTGSSGNVSVVPGPNNYAEGGNPDGYKGKEGANFDGTGPSPIAPDTSNRLFNIGTSSSKRYVGDSFLGGSTSFDLDFDIADEVSVIGFAFLNYHNFQSYQRGNSDYPNMHARVVWSNGTDSITEMAVEFSDQDADNDVYFGFQQPDSGYFLDSLAFYTIGNSARAWIGADEMGIAVGDGVAVPEPATAVLLLGLAAGGIVLYRRRRR